MILIPDCRVVALEEWKRILPSSAVTSATASCAAKSSAKKICCKHRIIYKMEDLVLLSILLEDYLQRIKSLESFRTILAVHGFFQETTINDRDQSCLPLCATRITGVSPDITCFTNSTIFEAAYFAVTVSFSSPLQFTSLFSPVEDACLLIGQTSNFLLFKYSIITLVFALVF